VKQTIIFAKHLRCEKGILNAEYRNNKMTGLVYKSTGSWYTVKSEQGDFIECRMKGKFRIKGIKSTNPIAVEMSWIMN
jgi:hypothetical protein